MSSEQQEDSLAEKCAAVMKVFQELSLSFLEDDKFSLGEDNRALVYALLAEANAFADDLIKGKSAELLVRSRRSFLVVRNSVDEPSLPSPRLGETQNYLAEDLSSSMSIHLIWESSYAAVRGSEEAAVCPCVASQSVHDRIFCLQKVLEKLDSEEYVMTHREEVPLIITRGRNFAKDILLKLDPDYSTPRVPLPPSYLSCLFPLPSSLLPLFSCISHSLSIGLFFPLRFPFFHLLRDCNPFIAPPVFPLIYQKCPIPVVNLSYIRAKGHLAKGVSGRVRCRLV